MVRESYTYIVYSAAYRTWSQWGGGGGKIKFSQFREGGNGMRVSKQCPPLLYVALMYVYTYI